jgi:hypothetical protein
MTDGTTKGSRRRGPKPDRRRALELLAASREGCTEAIMLAHGFTVELMVELVRPRRAHNGNDGANCRIRIPRRDNARADHGGRACGERDYARDVRSGLRCVDVYEGNCAIAKTVYQ